MARFQVRTVRIFIRLRAWIAIVVLIGIIIVLGRAVWGIYHKNKRAATDRLLAEQQINDLTIRQKSLDDRLAKLKTAQGLEEEIRENLPVAKVGEHVIVIIDNQDRASSTEETIGTTTKKSFWSALVPWSN